MALVKDWFTPIALTNAICGLNAPNSEERLSTRIVGSLFSMALKNSQILRFKAISAHSKKLCGKPM